MASELSSFLDDKDIQVAIIQAAAQITAAKGPNSPDAVPAYVEKIILSLCTGLEKGIIAAHKIESGN
jgi:hypothetical protein